MGDAYISTRKFEEVHIMYKELYDRSLTDDKPSIQEWGDLMDIMGVNAPYMMGDKDKTDFFKMARLVRNRFVRSNGELRNKPLPSGEKIEKLIKIIKDSSQIPN
ncbi:hypothetical protein ACFLZJ_00480 [Nanoarchaeota archaeon]